MSAQLLSFGNIVSRKKLHANQFHHIVKLDGAQCNG